MDFVRCIGEGILFSLILGIFSKKRPEYRVAALAAFMIMEILSVYFLYRGQETIWYFFVHPYIAFLIMDISDYAVYRRERFEKLVIWPLFVLPAMSGFVLCTGWIMKINAVGELIKAL